MYDIDTQDKIADTLQDLGYSLTALSRANQQRQPATVARLCSFINERLVDVAALASQADAAEAQPGKD